MNAKLAITAKLAKQVSSHKDLERKGMSFNQAEYGAYGTPWLKEDYVPSGWKAPGKKSRAVPGHEFGMDLSADDKHALIAFLKTL